MAAFSALPEVGFVNAKKFNKITKSGKVSVVVNCLYRDSQHCPFLGDAVAAAFSRPKCRVPKRPPGQGRWARAERGEKAVAANNCDNLLTCHRAAVGRSVDLVAGSAKGKREGIGAHAKPPQDKSR